MDEFTPEVRLRERVSGLIGRADCRPAELIDVMRWVRLVIEKEKLRDSYPHLSLYCDWLLHGEIDRHELVISLLERMNDAIVEYDKTKDISAVSKVFDLAALRAELTVLFTSHEVRTELVDSFQNWNTFVGIILEDTCKRPIKLPTKLHGRTKKKVEEAIERMKSRWKGFGQEHWASAFSLDLNRSTNPSTFFWTLKYESPTPPVVNMQSALVMTETPKDFRLP